MVNTHTPTLPGPMVDTAWLAAHLSDVTVVDGTYFLPIHQRDAAEEFVARHIPGAVRFDIDAIKDPSNPLPHMVPGPQAFAEAVGALGLGSDRPVVVYDGHGLMSAARVWWMLRLYGHDAVAVLDGGLPKWLAEGRPVESGVAPRTPRAFHATERPNLLADGDAVAAALVSRSAQVVDVRAADRFAGSAPEPRPGIRSGHMPDARNLPFTRLLAPDQTLLPPDKILAAFQAAGIDPDQPVIASCGSGVTACVAALALATTGRWDTVVYDGSWAEWGSDPRRAVVSDV
ncbi:MAG: 3-mercaptopyruvate sulfurtransferase [Alphaproteobacteria bacterium]|nr:MAG: 3-mercaptopyruvate sulfurtransferase [Alphaproteobacteria bacterium]